MPLCKDIDCRKLASTDGVYCADCLYGGFPPVTVKPTKVFGRNVETVFKSALDTQVGGSHYKSQSIQPVEYTHANNLGFIEGSIIKYITRWKDKNGVEDLKKIKHYVDLLIQLEEKGNE